MSFFSFLENAQYVFPKLHKFINKKNFPSSPLISFSPMKYQFNSFSVKSLH